MASTTHLIEVKKTVSPLAIWHLLSLDAPTVAALWTWFLARANHISLPIASPAAMAVAVWMLYAADRLLDSRALDANPRRAPHPGDLETRHLFHHRHRRTFLLGMALGAIALAALLLRLDSAAIRLYLAEGALLSGWFLILHATHSAHRLPKELAVGLFFSAAVFIPTVAREPGLRLTLLPVAILFAALCSLNCLFIYAWEHESPTRRTIRPPHATTRLALRYLTPITVFAAIAGAAIALLDPHSPRPIGAACVLSATLLLVLDRSRHHLPKLILRAAADLVLLTPLAFLPFIR